MAGTASLWKTPGTRCIITPSCAVVTYASAYSSSSTCLAASARNGASSSSGNVLRRSIAPGMRSDCPCLHFNYFLYKMQVDKIQQTGAVKREPRGISRRKRGEICCALAPSVSTEGKEYGYDSPKMKELIAFLEKDLVHLFDEQGIDKSMYDKNVDFRDPITKYGTLDGYLFNIQMLRWILIPKFQLHSLQQTGPLDITTRWTMTMNFLPLPWRPELIFTGTSVMTVNEETGKFCRHVDYWDSIQNNEYFSLEAVADLFKQLQIYKTPDLETPKYKVLKRTSVYEVRQYENFLVAETSVDQIAGNKGFNEVAGYLFGKNSTGEKMKMTTPVFNQTRDSSSKLQFVLPLQTEMSSVPSPLSEQVKVRPVEKTFAAAIKFNGETPEDVVKDKERTLRAALIKDGLEAEDAFLLARYNDPGRTRPFMRVSSSVQPRPN